LYLVILDRDGQIRCRRNLPAAPEPFLRATRPFRAGLIVGCECMHCWYWLADTCRDATIPFALGHAWGLKAVHGAQTKCDRRTAEPSPRLFKAGNFPLASPSPRNRRALPVLPRPRPPLPPQRPDLYAPVHTARRQATLPPVSSDVKSQSKRTAITADIADPFV